MSNFLADQGMRKITESRGLYHRLTLMVAPSGSGKTQALQRISRELRVPLLNVNLELSRRMLDLPRRQLGPKVDALLGDIIRSLSDDTVLLDNLEILFDASLQLEPLRLLQGLSRSHTIAAGWNGSVENNCITYAVPGHAEYRRYPIRDFLAVSLPKEE
ncbi:MAG: BREX-3 system P-loop-containing protein BrxF [Thermaerobacter sp.]|nr:BREX-3 system P-loop-containing protein BrxF [Thermaerobacter sp.]